MNAERELQRLYASGIRFSLRCDGSRYRVIRGDYIRQPAQEGVFPTFEEAVLDRHRGGFCYTLLDRLGTMRGVGRRDDNSRKNVRNVGKDSSASDTGSPEAPPRAVPPACAANCAVIVSAHDASGDTGQNCDPGIFTGNREFWPVSSESDGTRFGLANRRLRPLGHLTADPKYT